jgi:hypothetical protein
MFLIVSQQRSILWHDHEPSKPSRQVEFPDLPVLQTSRTGGPQHDKRWRCSWHPRLTYTSLLFMENLWSVKALSWKGKFPHSKCIYFLIWQQVPLKSVAELLQVANCWKCDTQETKTAFTFLRVSGLFMCLKHRKFHHVKWARLNTHPDREDLSKRQSIISIHLHKEQKHPCWENAMIEIRNLSEIWYISHSTGQSTVRFKFNGCLYDKKRIGDFTGYRISMLCKIKTICFCWSSNEL